MIEISPAPKKKRSPSPPKGVPRRIPESGYARGEETRRHIVEIALDAFGEMGFEQTSTRAIAARAGVNLGALTYYFGDKEGLHRACAEHIAMFAEARSYPISARIDAVLNDRATSRDDLLGLLRSLIDLTAEDVVAREGPQSWLLFMTREHANPTAASEILYERVMRGSIATLATLIGRITGRPADDPETIIRVLAIFGQWIVFRRMRRLALRALGWPDFRGERARLLKDVLWQQTEAALKEPATKATGTDCESPARANIHK